MEWGGIFRSRGSVGALEELENTALSAIVIIVCSSGMNTCQSQKLATIGWIYQ
jgi:hypothetical protein